MVSQRWVSTSSHPLNDALCTGVLWRNPGDRSAFDGKLHEFRDTEEAEDDGDQR